MEQRVGFTGISVYSAVEEFGGFVFSALATAGVVALVAMGLVLLLAN